jgi:hypothetical protein
MSSSDATTLLEHDLRAIFGNRLQSLVEYRAHDSSRAQATLAIVGTLTADDLRDCAARVVAWQDAGLATPLILELDEFGRSLDAFPFEFGAILADHTVVAGTDPFTGLRVDDVDLRRACEVQARSHLLHLREGYIETRGRGDALAELIARSSGALAALLKNIERLGLGRPPDALARIAALNGRTPSSDQAREMFPPYLATIKQLTLDIDRWSR